MNKLLALLLVGFVIFPLCFAPGASAAGAPFTALGTVLDRHGLPVQGAVVTLINDAWQELGKQTTDVNGNFEFTSVQPGMGSLIRVKVVFAAPNGKTYQTEYQNVAWYNTYSGIVQFDKRDTTLTDYPDPEYGYIWGVMQSMGANGRTLGNGVVYLVGPDHNTYYSFTSSGSGQGKGTFIMRVPIGQYKVYGQFQENGMLFQSPDYTINVVGTSDYTQAQQQTVEVQMSSPASAPNPRTIPSAHANQVSGYVTMADGSPLAETVITLSQATDDHADTFYQVAEARTDARGYYLFPNVRVTSDSPENSDIYTSKQFQVGITFTDPQGMTHNQTANLVLYNPNVILSYGDSDQSRNLVRNLTIADYSSKGWVQILCDPIGAKVYMDNKPLLDLNGTQYTAPCKAYLPAGNHIIKLSLAGYTDKTYPVVMKENTETTQVVAHLDVAPAPIVPPWVTLAVAVLILLIVVVIIIVLLASKRHALLGPLAGVGASLKKSADDFRSSGQARRAHKQHQAELKKAEQAQKAHEPSIPVRPPQLARKKQPETFSVATERAGLPEYRGEDEAVTTVSAREIYQRKEQPAIERVPHQQTLGGAKPAGFDQPPDQDGRIRIPKSAPVAPQTGSSLGERERVKRYVREHGDGVSFIQMSNELEIPPNRLTIITKELVINDDLEKVKGLYYYKLHDAAPDEGKSSVVVWRLDGDE